MSVSVSVPVPVRSILFVAALGACAAEPPPGVTEIGREAVITVGAREVGLDVIDVERDGDRVVYQVLVDGEPRTLSYDLTSGEREVAGAAGPTLFVVVDGDVLHACADAACSAGPVAFDELSIDQALIGLDLPYLMPVEGIARDALPQRAVEKYIVNDTCYILGGYDDGPNCQGVVTSCYDGKGGFRACFTYGCDDGGLYDFDTTCVHY